MEDIRQLAQQAAEDFNAKHGAQWLGVIKGRATVEVRELRELAVTRPGSYPAAALFEHFRGCKPTHAEIIALGKLLAALQVSRHKQGTTTLWRLDKELAERLS